MRFDAVRLTPGAAAGRLLVLTDPLSFYGGVDPDTGVIVQAGHPRRGECLTGRVLALPRSSGSTVGSWTLLRMANLGTAPAAVVSQATDAVLVTGTLAGGIVHLDGLAIDPAFCGRGAVIPEVGAWIEIDGEGGRVGDGAGPMEPLAPPERIGSVLNDRPSVILNDRPSVILNDRPAVIKLGGSLVTVKQSPVPRVDFDRLRDLARLLAAHLRGPAVILHGAGSFGHGPVARAGVLHRPLDLEARRDWGRIQGLQYQLSSLVCEALADAGLPVFPFQASALGRLTDDRFVPDTLGPVLRALELGLIPVLFGTPAFCDGPAGLAIASGDDLAPALALALGFSRIVHLTDVAGVHLTDPREDPASPVIPWISASNAPRAENLRLVTPTDVTGAMAGKLARLLEAAALGVDSWIVDGRDPAAVADALAGRPAGTVIQG
jgi:isopentenyl phosphate kinase/predicted aconitase with swiveling domain